MKQLTYTCINEGWNAYMNNQRDRQCNCIYLDFEVRKMNLEQDDDIMKITWQSE